MLNTTFTPVSVNTSSTAQRPAASRPASGTSAGPAALPASGSQQVLREDSFSKNLQRRAQADAPGPRLEDRIKPEAGPVPNPAPKPAPKPQVAQDKPVEKPAAQTAAADTGSAKTTAARDSQTPVKQAAGQKAASNAAAKGTSTPAGPAPSESADTTTTPAKDKTTPQRGGLHLGLDCEMPVGTAMPFTPPPVTTDGKPMPLPTAATGGSGAEGAEVGLITRGPGAGDASAVPVLNAGDPLAPTGLAGRSAAGASKTGNTAGNTTGIAPGSLPSGGLGSKSLDDSNTRPGPGIGAAGPADRATGFKAVAEGMFSTTVSAGPATARASLDTAANTALGAANNTALLSASAATLLPPALGYNAWAAPTPAATSDLPQAHISAPPGSREFAALTSQQITVFAANGVEQAQLQLNPAQMGPVTVQIQLTGDQAQVHLAADHALTRQLLEQAMPQLASSLRDAGLTLTGGGVFEQPRQNMAGNNDSGGAGRGDGRGVGRGEPGAGREDTTPVVATRGSATQRQRGVVDLVA
jgi:flagellar hook-length control protein FliK